MIYHLSDYRDNDKNGYEDIPASVYLEMVYFPFMVNEDDLPVYIQHGIYYQDILDLALSSDDVSQSISTLVESFIPLISNNYDIGIYVQNEFICVRTLDRYMILRANMKEYDNE